MNRTAIFKALMVSVFLMVWIAVPAKELHAQDILKYCCSDQVFESFENDNIEAFTRETGIKVIVRTSSSGRCAFRMMNGLSDIASMTRSLDPRHSDYGYKQIPFCIDPLDIIVNVKLGVDNISEKQLQDIFSNDINNWKDVGGPKERGRNNLPILVIVPGKNTAANKNFRRQVMKHKEIRFDLMADNSTKVIEAIQNYPGGAVSFISHGAIYNNKAIKSLKINGYPSGDKDYPFHQHYYYVTNGEPAGLVKQFIEFTFSEQGTAIIKNNGMFPFYR